MKNIILTIFLSLSSYNVVAKEYIYSKDKQFLPEKIEISDQKFLNNIFSYFNKDNIIESDDDYHNFKAVLVSKIFISQIDPSNLKVNVTLINNNRDWYIPRFEEKSVYSEKKIYLISDNKEIMNVYPEWWPQRKNRANSPSTYILRPEHVELFAKLKKGDSYNLEYIIEIPNSNENYFYFNLFYQDYSMPYVEVHKKYRKLNESFFPLLITKSNIIKVSCRRISDHKEDGYTCEFKEYKK